MPQNPQNSDDLTEKAPEVQIPAAAQASASGPAPESSPSVPPELSQKRPPIFHPTKASPSIKNEGTSLALIVTIGLVLLVIIVAVVIANSGGGSGGSTSSTTPSVVAGGSVSSTYPSPPPTPAPLYVPPVAKALDEKNGFKDFKFGMTIGEVKAVLEPTSIIHNPGV